MYAFDKKVPVKNTAPKRSKHNDRPVKETNGSRYYLDDAKLNAKSVSSNVVQRVLFADIPLDARGKFDYKGIGEMQVWWFMACEWKKQSDVESRDRVRLASHGYHGRICINGG